MNPKSSSEWALRKNHEIFHCERKRKDSEVKTLVLFTKGKRAFKSVA